MKRIAWCTWEGGTMQLAAKLADEINRNFHGRDGRKLMRLIMRSAKRDARRKKRRVRTLTDRQRAFIEAYIYQTRGNATAAARLVGYKWASKVGPALVYHPLINPILNARVGLILACHTGPFRAGLLTFNGES